MWMDSLLSIVQMPADSVATTAIGVAGAKNAALLALQILGINDQQPADCYYCQRMHDQQQKKRGAPD